MSPKSFQEKIESGEAKVLTVAVAKLLRGKQIAWMYLGYKDNQNTVQEMTIGDIIPELDYNESQPCDGFKSRAEYWRSYMNEKQLDEKRTNLLLLDTNGKWPYIYAFTKYCNFYDTPTFTCSDADREIFYIEI